jgi:hypothetical protein
MKGLLLALTDQSTIIFIFFADMPSQAARTQEHMRRGHKSRRWLTPQSGLDPDYFHGRNQVRVYLS